ncbi:SPFH domain-containing protein [Cohnella algarum]|uniref:SPFH domain-containing protein n=1 Tax=Cohnella algarum TaxID=2044859 RepID=UPI00196836EF|nr:SPFH domain-containing protein [Cohnella algarum]MBN2981605.1 SPFH domain-containing protein [Cohnella algarum]
MIFWKWNNREIKKGSKLVIRADQDAIFIQNGKIEGIFKDEGTYSIESDIVPFLSTLRGFKFGFNSGMPIRANGTFNFKVNDYVTFIDKIAGIKESYLVGEMKILITSALDQLLMKWISKEGKDMFNLQANAADIARGIREDLDMQVMDKGMAITGFQVMSFSYPKEIQEMITKAASHEMIGNLSRYQQVSMTDGIASVRVRGGGAAADMAGMAMGMNMAGEMLKNMQGTPAVPPPNARPAAEKAAASADPSSDGAARPNFCPNCGAKNEGSNFCPNCGQSLRG